MISSSVFGPSWDHYWTPEAIQSLETNYVWRAFIEDPSLSIKQLAAVELKRRGFTEADLLEHAKAVGEAPTPEWELVNVPGVVQAAMAAPDAPVAVTTGQGPPSGSGLGLGLFVVLGGTFALLVAARR